MENIDIARIFEEIADLLEIQASSRNATGAAIMKRTEHHMEETDMVYA